MKKGDYVVRVISVFGYNTATITKVSKVSDGSVEVVDSEHLRWGSEEPHEVIDPVMAGCMSYLVPLEDDSAALNAFWKNAHGK